MDAPNHEHSGTPASDPSARPKHFIEQLIEADIALGRWGTWPDLPGEGGGELPGRIGKPRVHTRFPPEPNGYLHVGHAKSICLNFGLAKAYGGKFNLRFDDTNPAKEEREYVDSIKRDVAWLASAFGAGSFDVGPHAGGLFFASDYFEKMYEFAVDLVNKGKAYVCQLTADEVSARRGKPGVPATSPHRDRPREESLKLLEEMRRGVHPDGSMTLRAKIDLASNNFNLRDPVMYRILHQHHHNTGDKWCIYPMYDWAHGIEDSLEGITHSICTLEFEDHRPLYDWFIKSINEGRSTPVWHSQQIEFAKLIPTYTLLSKRNLLKLVQEKLVDGWDDPRMPTVAGMRRRGYTAESIKNFCEEIGVTKTDSLIDVGRLEASLREHLNRVAPRAMAVLDPIKVVVENWPEGQVDDLDFVINPEDPSAGTRKVPFSRELWIEREDFMEEPPKKFFRLAPGAEVRLRWAYFLKCERVIKDDAGNIVELRCTIDPATRGGDAPIGPDGKPTKKVKGTIHWVSAAHAVPAEVRLFDRLFAAEEPGKRTGNFMDDLNRDSKRVVRAFIEPWLAEAAISGRGTPVSGIGTTGGGVGGADVGLPIGGGFQFERLGYFCTDPDSRPDAIVFNRTVTLKDTWAKEASKS